MIVPFLLSSLLAFSLWLILTSHSALRRRPDLEERLDRLTSRGRDRQEQERGDRAAVFASGALETMLRPLLDDVGRVLGRLTARLGVSPTGLERRLALAWPGMTVAQFYGQKLATGLVFGVIFPLMNLIGIQPFGVWPLWLWVAGFAAGFALPDWTLTARLERRRAEVLAALPSAVDLVAIAASAGLSPEQALVEAGRQVEGVLGEGLRTVAREAGLGTATHGEGLRTLAEREGVPELGALADAWRLAQEQGLPLSGAMLALGDTVRDRQRTRLLEVGSQSTIRMLFPVTVFIFPVFLVVLLYPAGITLLGVGR
jgi:tight adherence protein C